MGNVLGKAAAIDFLLQWGLFLIAAYLKTEKFYDLAGTSTFILLAVQSLIKTNKFFPRQVIQTGLVATWAARLGLFLFFRILKDGKDRRFNRVRDNPKRFFIYWTMQGVWVLLTLMPTLILNSKEEDKELSVRDYTGWGLWLLGVLLESVADYQKYIFRSNPANKDRWISHGLWGVVRHPNYLGEMLLWSGLYLSASSTLQGREKLGVISPIFVIWLLSQLSGIPMLERIAMKKWKDNPEFLAYLQRTSRLIPYLY